jgi:cysteinyl-tRNA synthetase
MPLAPSNKGHGASALASPGRVDHAFTYTAYGQLIRYLELKGICICYAQNVANIDDDILKKAKETGQDWRQPILSAE